MRSEYQKDVISRYYENLDTIMLQKVGELVSELYLANSEAKRMRLWKRVHKAMIQLKINRPIVEHIMKKKDIEILAKNLQDWLGASKKRI